MMAQQDEPIGDIETSFEVTYRAKINDYLTVQPNVQYVVHPAYAFSSTTKDALVVGLHFEFGKVFSW
jgi:carbohydrate-selective porin OprB